MHDCRSGVRALSCQICLGWLVFSDDLTVTSRLVSLGTSGVRYSQVAVLLKSNCLQVVYLVHARSGCCRRLGTFAFKPVLGRVFFFCLRCNMSQLLETSLKKRENVRFDRLRFTAGHLATTLHHGYGASILKLRFEGWLPFINAITTKTVQ